MKEKSKHELLIDALKKERDQFDKRGQSTKEHDATIEYLNTGFDPYGDYRFDLLDAAKYDLEQLYDDYI